MEFKCRLAPPHNLRVILLKTIKKGQSGVSNGGVIGGILKYLAVIHLMAFQAEAISDEYDLGKKKEIQTPLLSQQSIYNDSAS